MIQSQLMKPSESADLRQAARFPAYCLCLHLLQRAGGIWWLRLDPWKIKGQTPSNPLSVIFAVGSYFCVNLEFPGS